MLELIGFLIVFVVLTSIVGFLAQGISRFVGFTILSALAVIIGTPTIRQSILTFPQSLLPPIIYGVIGVPILYLFFSIKIIGSGEQALVERNSRFIRKLSTGIHLIIPFVDRIATKTSIKETYFQIQSQTAFTGDNVFISVDAVLYWRITQLERTFYVAEDIDIKESLSNLFMVAIRAYLSKVTLQQARLSLKNDIESTLHTLNSTARHWGVQVTKLDYKIQNLEPILDVNERNIITVRLSSKFDSLAYSHAIERLREQGYEATIMYSDALDEDSRNKNLIQIKYSPSNADRDKVYSLFLTNYDQYKLELDDKRLSRDIKPGEDQYKEEIRYRLIELKVQMETLIKVSQSRNIQQVSVNTGDGSHMQGQNNQNISANRDLNIAATNSVVNLRDISGQVTNSINELPAAAPDRPDIKSVLEQLQQAIETSPELSDADKKEALEQVKAIAEAGKNPDQPEQKNVVKSALRWIKGTLTELSEMSAIVTVAKEVLPTIVSFFAL